MRRTFLAFAAVVCLSACAQNPAPSGLRPPGRFADRLRAVTPTYAAPGTSGSFKRHERVTRGGVERDAVTLIAPVTVRAGLQGYEGRCILSFQAAPVFNLGDGMTLSIFAVSGGGRTEIYRRYFDAGRIAGDRKWVPVRLSLELGPGAATSLEFQLAAGPQGDLVTDWLALADLSFAPEI